MNRKGFTLIELIVSIALLMLILGVIGSLFIPVLKNYYTVNTDVDYQNTLTNISNDIDEQIRYLSDITLSNQCLDDYVCITAANYQDQFHDQELIFDLTFTSFDGGIDKVMHLKKANERVYTLTNSLKMMNYAGSNGTTSYTCLNYKTSKK